MSWSALSHKADNEGLILSVLPFFPFTTLYGQLKYRNKVLEYYQVIVGSSTFYQKSKMCNKMQEYLEKYSELSLKITKIINSCGHGDECFEYKKIIYFRCDIYAN